MVNAWYSRQLDDLRNQLRDATNALESLRQERDDQFRAGEVARARAVRAEHALWVDPEERTQSWRERAGMMEAERDAARLQADEWKRYAESLDAGVGSTMEEQRDAAREIATRYVARCATALVEREEARTLVRRLTWALGWCDYASGVYAQRGVSDDSDAAVKDGEQTYDDAAAAIRRWDAAARPDIVPMLPEDGDGQAE